MSNLVKYLSIPLVSLVLMGCSDPREPSTDNYKKALQSSLDKYNRSCFIITNSRDVLVGEKAPFVYEINTKNVPNSGILSQLNKWVKRGVLELKESREYSNMYGTTSVFSYDYTDKAKKTYEMESNLYNNNIKGRKFCMSSKRVLEDIVQVSDPLVDSRDGETYVNVVATYKVTGLPDWAYEYDDYKKPTEEKYKLVLMHDGWVERSQIK